MHHTPCAAGSSAKAVCICFYEGDNHWWAAKLIRRKHESSVVCVAWHPLGTLVATGCCDNKCRVFSVLLPGKRAPLSLLWS